MSTGLRSTGRLLGLLLAAHIAMPAAADTGAIRIRAPRKEPGSHETGSPLLEARRGFNYEAFDARLEALWFQRKAFLARGRDEEAANQSQLIRSFCSEEGVRRLEELAGALLVEARRDMDEGNYGKALASLDLAEFFDPGRSQTRVARAAVFWNSGRGSLAAAIEALAAARAAAGEAWKNPTWVNHFLLVLNVALIGLVVVFALLMLVRYQIPLRHEVEEWITARAGAAWAKAGGWTVVLLPLVSWIGAGWAVPYWITVSFRFMRRAEKVAAIVLLVAAVAALPAFRLCVALYGISEDPMVHTTLASAGGAYDPDRVVKLKQLVSQHPEDPVYRFLLAGLYKNGRYFEEAYHEYRKVLALDPATHQAHINLGNVFFLMGQYPEAVVHYRKALESRPDSVLAYYDLYLAQSELFRFKDAQESLEKGNTLDPKGMADLLFRSGRDGGRPVVVDATVDLGSIWRAALEGRPLRASLPVAAGGATWPAHLRSFFNPVSLFCLLCLLACGGSFLVLGHRLPAGRCVRCGRPFCSYCRNPQEAAREYCSQCLHLFVLGDGLAPETKTLKLYEVERHAKLGRLGRRLGSLLLPGTAQLLRGRAARGCVLILIWLAAILAWQPTTLLPIGWLMGVDLRLDLLRPDTVPARFAVNAAGVLGLTAAALVWVLGNSWRLRAREA